MTVLRLLVYFVFCPLEIFSQVTVSGIIREQSTAERIPYATVCLDNCAIGVSANSQGYYAIQVIGNASVKITYSSAGYSAQTISVALSKDSVIDVTLAVKTTVLDEVVVTYADSVSTLSMSSHMNVNLAELKRMPSLLGEKDVFRMLQSMPGVQRASEASVALYVRGGSPDQNLILLDDAPVYNAFHLFGLFSVFNTDAVSRIDFWKGGFPARYGGRGSSVIDIMVRDGSREKLKASGAIGLLSSRMTLEGPLWKGSTFMLSARRSYLDLLVTPFLPDAEKWRYVLGDVNLKVTQELGTNDKLIVSAYGGRDRFGSAGGDNSTESETDLHWGNITGTLKWNHLFTNKLFLTTTATFSGYDFGLTNSHQAKGFANTYALTSYSSSIKDISIKSDLDIFVNNGHKIRSGLIATHHQYKPRIIRTEDNASATSTDTVQQYNTKEFGVYVEDQWKAKKKLRADYGLRLAALYTKTRSYLKPEPRVSLNYEIRPSFDVNGSYSRANQFVHLLSNTGVGLSTDLWVPVTERIPPLTTDQFVVGMSKNWLRPGLKLTLESFRKRMQNVVSYTDDATFLAISGGGETFRWEENVTIGNGKSYGTEIFFEKTSGKFTGWVAYTLMWVAYQFPELNGGQPFFPKHDSRHNISTQLSYQISSKISFSTSWLYNSGNTYSAPHSFYPTNSTLFHTPLYVTSMVPYFGSQNSFRGDAFHRLDIAMRFSKKRKRFERYWEVGVYNAYARKNPFYYYLSYDYDPSVGQTVSTLKSRYLFLMVPSITYHFQI